MGGQYKQNILNIGPPKPKNSILPDEFTAFLGNCFCVERLCPHLVCMTRKGIDNSHGCENHQKTWLQNAARVLDIVVFEVASITAQAAKITKILGCSKICKSFRAKPLDCCLEFGHQRPLRRDASCWLLLIESNYYWNQVQLWLSTQKNRTTIISKIKQFTIIVIIKRK